MLEIDKLADYADSNGWLNANYPNVGQKNKKRIEDLLDGLQDGRFPQYTCQPIENIKLKNINKAELHVFRPDMNGFSENDWINAIKSKLPVGEKDNIIITITEL